MHPRGFLRPRARGAALFALCALAVAALSACGASNSAAGQTSSLKPVTIGLTYVPNIQFAPFYVADALGYYKDAGLKVTLRHHAANEDEFAALVAGKEDLIFASGDEVAQVRGRTVPVVYVANMFAKYPVALIVPAGSAIHSAADLRGHTVGIPGAYGATYFGLLALLESAGLTKSAITIQSIGYTQVPALLGHRVDAVMGYLNNEPIAFQKAGFAVRTLAVGDVQPLVSNGLAALQSELGAHPDIVKAAIKATLRGLDYTLAHPQEAVNLSKHYVPTLNDATQADALAVLQATLPLWRTSGKVGYSDPQAWQSMIAFLQAQGQLAGPVDAAQSFSNAYLPS